MDIEIPYQPRPLQEKIHNDLKRFSVICCHRRFGKTVFAVNHLIMTACEIPNARLAYIAPTYRQGKAVAYKSSAQTIQMPYVDLDLMECVWMSLL